MEPRIMKPKVMSHNHAMEGNEHHGMCFILLLHFVHQQTIQSTIINDLVPPPPCGMELNLSTQGTQ